MLCFCCIGTLYFLTGAPGEKGKGLIKRDKRLKKGDIWRLGSVPPAKRGEIAVRPESRAKP
jgi:hypothetical protein